VQGCGGLSRVQLRLITTQHPHNLQYTTTDMVGVLSMASVGQCLTSRAVAPFSRHNDCGAAFTQHRLVPKLLPPCQSLLLPAYEYSPVTVR
jgi:hypothetical protein